MAHTRKYPLIITLDGDDVDTASPKIDGEFDEIYNILNNIGAINLSDTKRQSVLYASTGTDGNPNYITASGLNVSINGSIKPVILAFANGFDNNKGSVDVIDSISSLVSSAWTLTANQTYYLYIDKDISTGLISYGQTLLLDQYLKAAPSSPALDQHYYNTNECKMYRWNGSAWENKQRIFVAKAVTDTSATTLITRISRNSLQGLLVAEINVTSPVSSITFNNLDGISDGGYILESDILGISLTSVYNLYINGYTEPSEYVTQHFAWTGSTATYETTSSKIMALAADSHGFTLTDISFWNGLVAAFSKSVIASNYSSMLHTRKITPVTNITSITISSSISSGINTGSRFRLYRRL